MGATGRHFNEMADEIEQVLARNQELNRRLEERVQEATLKVVQLQKQVNQLQQLTALGYLTATLATIWAHRCTPLPVWPNSCWSAENGLPMQGACWS